MHLWGITGYATDQIIMFVVLRQGYYGKTSLISWRAADDLTLCAAKSSISVLVIIHGEQSFISYLKLFQLHSSSQCREKTDMQMYIYISLKQLCVYRVDPKKFGSLRSKVGVANIARFRWNDYGHRKVFFKELTIPIIWSPWPFIGRIGSHFSW